MSETEWAEKFKKFRNEGKYKGTLSLSQSEIIQLIFTLSIKHDILNFFQLK